MQLSLHYITLPLVMGILT